MGSGQYRPFAAQRLAAGRRARPGRGKLVRDPVLRQFVQQRLGKRWSPEQISAALRVEFPDKPARHVVRETIYQAIYRPELGGLRRELSKALRTGRRRRRKPHRHPDGRRHCVQRPVQARSPPRLRRCRESQRSAQGKTHRDIRRSLKRALARRLYRRIEAATRLHELAADTA